MADGTDTPAKKPAAKRRARKPAATTAKNAVAAKRTGAARRRLAAAQERDEAAKAKVETAAVLSEIGLHLSGLVSGRSEKADGGMVRGDSGEVEADRQAGITLEEISEMLRRRESRGFYQGHQEALRQARRDFGLRLQRERSDAVAGALLMVTNQLQGVLHDLAAASAPERQAQGRLALVVLVKELSRVADRLSGGRDEELLF